MLVNSSRLDSYNFKNKKVFISQPMKGKKREEIENERKNIVDVVTSLGGEVIQSILPEEILSKNKPLWCLGESLKMLAEADVAIFLPGWKDARGCVAERYACQNYEIDAIEI